MSPNTYQPNVPGIYYGLPASVYRDAPGVSNSTLNEMNPPSRCLHHLTQPPEEPTIAMVMGTLIHDAILRQPSMAIALVPETYPPENKPWNFNATYCKEWRESQRAAGRVILKQAELDKVNGCIRAILSVPECAALFAKGKPEVSVFTQRDVFPGPGNIQSILTKSRIDWVPEGVNFLIDIKKVSSGMADPAAFTRLAIDRGYHRQAASYLSAWNAESGEDRKGMLFVVVEDEEPHPVSLIFLDADAMSAGSVGYHSRLERFAECKATNTWPSYGTGFQFPVTPTYLLRNAV